MNLGNITALVVDCGLFVDLASKLAQTYGKVYYHCPWVSGFPKMNSAFIGVGIEGLEVVDDVFGPHFDDVDIFIFPDVYFGPLQEHLVKLGKRVWGSRLGENLELCRDGTKELMKKLGLPVSKYAVVEGMDALRDFLKQNPDVWVKINKYRGHFETFHAPDYNMVEPRLTEIEGQLGALKYLTKFVVEENLKDKVEYAVDTYCIDGQLPSKLLYGIEIKDLGYIGKFGDYAKLPAEIRRFDTAMAPVLKKYGYRNFYSPETRIGKDKVGYMIDMCARAGSPPNEVYQDFYLNLADIIWEGSEGRVIDPVPVSAWAAEVLIHSPWADKNWQPIDFPSEYRDFIKLRNAIKIKGRYYVVPQAVGLPEIGAVVGYGATMEEAADMAREIAKEIKGYFIEIPENSLDEAEENIKKINKIFPGMM